MTEIVALVPVFNKQITLKKKNPTKTAKTFIH